MGICRFFQQGSCRFGTKCTNEHFDVKVVLKNDMEASINGKMWPFSVYGPFKDKGNIPNFIEDQSFEEVRLLCYEAKRLNSFDQFHQQFNREVMEATNKMKSMVQATPQVVDVMIKIFDAPEGGTPAVAGAPNQNPFAATAGNAAGSIFSKPTLGGGNILGAANQVNNTQSLFGGSMAAGNTGNSIFGGGNVAGGGSVFGQQQPQQQQQGVASQPFQGGNIFAQAQAQPQAANQMPFGGFQQQPQQQQLQPGAGGGVFGQAAVNPSGGIFGQVAQQPPSGLFAQAAQTVGFPQQQPQQMMQQQQAQQQQMMQQANPQQQQLLQQQQQMMQQQQQQQQMMQQQQQQQQQQQPQQPQQPGGSSVYSTMESLTPEEIEAFKAEQFLPGHVPFNPPPRELC
ncbi:ras-interacting protein RIP3 [Drosophila guanche]|uniref:Nucleoporin NUP42 n=1 Tax=Drosophila guanche TaxID=7266 RepID=A0A3B0K7S0_DROGU|nr:ras-interacting protein RIP3 [Drosophila guanche]SPP79568.1 Hypothetical predicted protein [Drosophila guanche]